MLHGWFSMLTRIAPTPLRRVLIDQLSFGPLAHVAFFTYMPLAKGGSLDDVKAELKAKFLPALCANWMVWPLVQAVNFTYMPLRYRVLFVNIVGCFYSVFLSTLAHTSIDEVDTLAGRGDCGNGARKAQS